jgi:tRNA modification GTPase
VNTSTAFSVLTPTGRGAVAVVAVAGPAAVTAIEPFFRAKNRQPLSEQKIARIVYGNWQTHGEDLVVCRRDAERVEIHCHGGSLAVATISADLTAAGCREISWQDWLSRNEVCPLRVESQIALSQAASTRVALILLDQFHGALRNELTELVQLLRANSSDARKRIERLLSTAELGLHLTRPWQVVIAGRPNVGKSSLINALVGYRRAIVFDQPGTTRDVVTASTVIDGWPVSLSDTAGLHHANDELEVAGIELAKERLVNADLVIWVLDASQMPGDSLHAEMERQISELGLQAPAKRLLVLNKIDRVSDLVIPGGAIATSATYGTGIEELLAAISGALVPVVPPAGAAVVFTERQLEELESALRENREASFELMAEPLEKLLTEHDCN